MKAVLLMIMLQDLHACTGLYRAAASTLTTGGHGMLTALLELLVCRVTSP